MTESREARRARWRSSGGGDGGGGGSSIRVCEGDDDSDESRSVERRGRRARGNRGGRKKGDKGLGATPTDAMPRLPGTREGIRRGPNQYSIR